MRQRLVKPPRPQPWLVIFFALGAGSHAAAKPHVSSRDSLLPNGGFERGDFRDWTLSGNTQFTQVFDQPYDGVAPHGGADYALLGSRGTDGEMAQSFADIAGAPLTITFWLASDGGRSDDFSASFDGAALVRLADTGAFGWTRFAEEVTGSGWDTLSFSFRDDQDYLMLDQVRVGEATTRPLSSRNFGTALAPAFVPARAIPEPSWLWLWPAPLALTVFLRHRRRRSA